MMAILSTGTCTTKPLTLVLAITGWALFLFLAVLDILAVVFVIKKWSGIVGVGISLQHYFCVMYERAHLLNALWAID